MSTEVSVWRLVLVAMVPAMVAALGFGVVWLLTPESATPGVPALREIHLAGQHLPVLLTPLRPGANLVLVGGQADGVRVGVDPANLVDASDRVGTNGKWTVVDLPAGSATVWLELAGQRASVDVDTGHGEPAGPGISGPDGPECAAEGLGAVLADPRYAPTSCPADALGPADESSLRALVGFLAGRGVHTLTVAADGSARSIAAAAAVRDAAEHDRLAVAAEPSSDGALVVVSGWASANQTLATVSGRQQTAVSYSAGTYLAPWLLSGPVISTSAGAVLPLRFDPRDPRPVEYQLAIETRFHGQLPTAAGYRGWLAGKGIDEPSATRLFAASRVAFLPKEFAMHQHGHDGGWVPGGTVVPVTGPLG